MSEDVLDEVLEYSRNHVEALKSRPNALRHVLACDICNSIMLDPYTLQCGHSFCGKCLEPWTRERESMSTCPTCRTALSTHPVMSLGLRQLALAVVASWNEDPQHTEKVPPELLTQREQPQFFPEGALDLPRYDSEDDVYRCPSCGHEVEDGHCSSCGRAFHEFEQYLYPRDDSWHTDTDYEEDDRIFRRFGTGTSFVRDEISDDDSDAADLQSFVMDDDDVEENSSQGSSSLDEDVNEDEMIGDDDRKEVEGADDTSDDSLLEETRRTHRDDDVQIVGVVGARHVVIDDDSD